MDDTDRLRIAFAQVLVRRRTRKRWSQVELAAFSGVEHSYVSRLEKGDRTPSLEVIVRLSKAFQISPERLVKEVRLDYEALEA